MEYTASDEDELYYTSKNFMKLKYSNTAYIENTNKEKEENRKEIENLKKEYEKLKLEVVKLRKDTLYASNKVKLGGNILDNNEVNYLKLKLDKVKSQKIKAKDEWKKNDEQLNAIKNEYKLLCDDNNPYTRRIKMLENKLDKAMIKYNEATSIKRTYEQIMTRLKEERSGFDNQVSSIQKSLKAKQHDSNEFMLLLQDAKQAKGYSELLLKNTELSKEAFEQYFEKLLREHDKKGKEDKKFEKTIDKKKIEKPEYKMNNEDENIMKITNENIELDNKVKEFEEANKLIRETTGADDINEICQKYSNLRETKDKLKKERKELEKTCEILSKKKDDLAFELNLLKYQGQDDITRKEIEDNEKTADRTFKACEDSKLKLKKAEKLSNDVKAGFGMIVSLLRSKIFEEIFSDDKNFTERELPYRQAYREIVNSDDLEMRHLLNKCQEVCEFVFARFKYMKENYPVDEGEARLNRKEENDLEQVYLHQSIESMNNSGSNNEDDDIDNKDYGFKSERAQIALRSNTADQRFKRNTKITLKPIDKRKLNN